MKVWFIYFKIALVTVLEAVLTGIIAAMPMFYICYACDKMFGQHLMVNTADRCFLICNIIGLVIGAVAAGMSTRNAYKAAQGITKKEERPSGAVKS